MLDNRESPIVDATRATTSNHKKTLMLNQHLISHKCIIPANEIEEQIDAMCTAWPILSEDALHGIAGEIVNLATKNSEVDPAAILLTALSWFGTSVGSKPYINIGDTKHPARLFTVLVGSTSRARKGTSEKPVRRIFELAEKIENLTPLNIAPGPLSTGEGLIYAVRDTDEKSNDGITDKRILCLEPEFSSVLRMGKRDGNTLSTIVRQVWDGGDIQPLTKSNRIKATGAHIGIIGHITCQELNMLLSSTDTWNGFANRFLWACVRRSRHVALPTLMPDEEINYISKNLSHILKYSSQQSRIILTSEAEELWVEEYSILTIDALDRFGAVTSCAEAQTIRLALVYALMDGKCNIGVSHLKAAIALWQFCHASAKFLFGTDTIDPNIHKLLHNLGEGEKTTTELNNLFSDHFSSRQLNELLGSLQLLGKITCSTQGGGYRKGKAAKVWRLL